MTTTSTTTTFSREMGLTHAEFFRTLPAAMGGQAYQVSGRCISVEDGDRRLTILLDPEGERRIALLRLPVTRVSFEFSRYTQQDIDAFMKRFERHFQRGGG